MNINKPNLIPVPAIPADWIAHSGMVLAGNGLRTHVKAVLHKVGGYHPYVVHTAYVSNDEWCYERGTYCKTEEEGIKAFAGRQK